MFYAFLFLYSYPWMFVLRFRPSFALATEMCLALQMIHIGATLKGIMAFQNRKVQPVNLLASISMVMKGKSLTSLNMYVSIGVLSSPLFRPTVGTQDSSLAWCLQQCVGKLQTKWMSLFGNSSVLSCNLSRLWQLKVVQGCMVCWYPAKGIGNGWCNLSTLEVSRRLIQFVGSAGPPSRWLALSLICPMQHSGGARLQFQESMYWTRWLRNCRAHQS